jgi:hypothetical protein
MGRALDRHRARVVRGRRLAELDPHGALDRVALAVEAVAELELHRRAWVAERAGLHAAPEPEADRDDDGRARGDGEPRGQGLSSPPNRRTACTRRPWG